MLVKRDDIHPAEALERAANARPRAVKEDGSARRFTDERPDAGPQPPAPPRRFLSKLTSAERKQYPVVAGFVDYFPDAMAVVANVSYKGNEKHNPGQPTHWARGKSADHADCIVRHVIERDFLDPDGIEHAAEMAWRAMAYLQEMLERKYNLDLPRGATPPGLELETTALPSR